MWHLRSFRVAHYVILNIILYAGNELNDGKLTFFPISFVKLIQNNVQCVTQNGIKCHLYLSDVHAATQKN